MRCLWKVFAFSAGCVLGLSALGQAQAFSIFADGFETGDLCGGWSGGSSLPDCPPIFPGLTLTAVTDETELTLAWTPAVDDLTPARDIRYRLHISTTPEFDPGPGTLQATVVGAASMILTGLQPATLYYILVLAEDGAGNTSLERDYRAITTAAFPVILSAMTPLQTSDGLGLGEPLEVHPSRLVFGNLPEAQLPQIGALLIVNSGDSGLLRRVEGVEVMPATIEVSTSTPALEEAVEQINVSSVGTLPEMVDPARRAGGRGLARYSESKKVLSDGAIQTSARWHQRLLAVDRLDHSLDRGWLRLRPEQRMGSHNISISDDLLLQLELDFTPDLLTDVAWNVSGLRQARLVARGTLDVGIRAEYSFDAAASYSPAPFELFTTTWTAVYSVGPVPVYQRVTLKVEAEVTASASASIEAVAEAIASATVEVGVEFDQASGWQPVAAVGTSRSFTSSLAVAGGATVQIKLIPEVSVEFYELVTGRIAVQPYLSAEVGVEATPQALCAPFELSTFDILLGVDCNVAVDFTPFSIDYTLFDAQVCSPTWPLFDLPQLTVSSSGTGPVLLTATVTDGTNNPPDPDSMQWAVVPASGTVVADSGLPTQATLTCTESGLFSVTFAAHGRLGEIARQCVQAEVSCSPEAPPGTVVEIIDEVGDGGPNPLDGAFGVATDDLGNAFVSGRFGDSDNVFKITPAGVVTSIVGPGGDGLNVLDGPTDIAVDDSGNVYVVGVFSDNAFKITPAGVITEIIDQAGDGLGNLLDTPAGIAVDSSGNVFVTALATDNAFKITPAGTITEIIDGTGDGKGNGLDSASGVAVDRFGNVFVAGSTSSNVFKILPAGGINLWMDATDAGMGNTFVAPRELAVGSSGNLYVVAWNSNNAFRINPAGAVTEIIDESGDNQGHMLAGPEGVALDGLGNVYVAGGGSNNVFRITPGGAIREIIDGSGDGLGNLLRSPRRVAVDGSGNVYVPGLLSDNAFRILSP